jgi:hypothetical protein
LRGKTVQQRATDQRLAYIGVCASDEIAFQN